MNERTSWPSRRKIGLVLGSGLARGWAHIGVLRGLKRLGLEPDIVAGCSVGAVVGGVYLAGKLDIMEQWVLSLTKKKIISYLDLRLRSGGLIGGNKLTQEIVNHVGDLKIEELSRPFVAVATDLVTGHEIWLQKGRMVDCMRASFAMPGVFPPIRLNGRFLFDGALVNPVPVAACRALGADMVIAVNLNADIIGKARQPGSSIPSAAGFDLLKMIDQSGDEGAPTIDSLSRRVFRRESNNPSLFGVMVSAMNVMQDRITRSRMAGEPPDVMIAPRLGGMGLLEFDRAEDAIAEGELAVSRMRPEIADALSVLAQSAIEQSTAPAK
ncbi:MAG TPA: patatin-like phospholipase family protein [Alphaproteobacteria bacterium]|nr:patatin-like phospholipase family protein [Alphaproteobacteria bacterium]